MPLLLKDALDAMNVDQLKHYLFLISGERIQMRKADLVETVAQKFKHELPQLFLQLDPCERMAVGEAVNSEDGVVDRLRFKAKYGKFPDGLDQYPSRHHDPPLIKLFLHQRRVPDDIKTALQKIAPKPAKLTLPSTDEIPKSFERKQAQYKLQPGDKGIVAIVRNKSYRIPRQEPEVTILTTQIPIEVREMEYAAPQDLLTVLRLVAQKKVAVSEKSLRPSAASTKELSAMLCGQDFYAVTTKADKSQQEIGTIRSFAWPLLLQAAKLAELHGTRMSLTNEGIRALGEPAAQTLARIWHSWLNSKFFDEFQRIDQIKGQTGKGARALTAVTARRSQIIEALRSCPTNRWVNVDDLSQFMQASGLRFEVSRDPWSLYIGDSRYGCLAYDGASQWSIVEGRYILCFLFEYAATLGLIDVAYVPPDQGPHHDFGQLWGTDDLSFLSRYDGLLYFRINSFGAYCLGVAENYVPQKIAERVSLSVMPSMQINVVGDAPLPTEHALLLDTYAEQESPTVWRLAKNKTLAALESGHDIDELRQFLESCDEQPLPETVQAFMSTSKKNARALRMKGFALLVECADEETAAAIANHRSTSQLCQRSGKKDLVVLAEYEQHFRKFVNVLGYGMPKV